MPVDFYPLADTLHRSVALTDDAGDLVEAYDTDAYGNTLIFDAAGTGGDWFADDATQTDEPANEFIFTGRRFDPETENYFYRARYYVPQQGRFVARDLVNYEDGMGLYVYVHSRPLSVVDPYGLAGCSNGGCAMGGSSLEEGTGENAVPAKDRILPPPITDVRGYYIRDRIPPSTWFCFTVIADCECCDKNKKKWGLRNIRISTRAIIQVAPKHTAQDIGHEQQHAECARILMAKANAQFAKEIEDEESECVMGSAKICKGNRTKFQNKIGLALVKIGLHALGHRPSADCPNRPNPGAPVDPIRGPRQSQGRVTPQSTMEDLGMGPDWICVRPQSQARNPTGTGVPVIPRR